MIGNAGRGGARKRGDRDSDSDRDGPAVRTLARGFSVIRALQARRQATLAELHVDTGLPKPTLLRLLRALEAERIVWRARGDGAWRPAMRLAPEMILSAGQLRLVEVALPHLEALREKVVWPSDLAVRQDDCMRLLETTRRASRLAVNRDSIGHRIDLLRSAVGRAWLAAASERERVQVLARLARRAPASVPPRERLAALLEEVRHRGYATRDPRYRGRDGDGGDDDQLAAIAVPVRTPARVIACVNIVWLRRFDARRQIVERHLADLEAAAAAIARDLEARATRSSDAPPTQPGEFVSPRPTAPAPPPAAPARPRPRPSSARPAAPTPATPPPR